MPADLCFCSCLSLMASSRRGLGMKAMSAPSLTSRPIHQSLLYFCQRSTAESGHVWRRGPPEGRAERATTHFFDVQEVFGIEVDCSSLDGTVLVQSSAVAHIRLDCKRYRFGLEDKSTSEIIVMTLFRCRGFLLNLDKKSKKLQDVSVSRWRHIMLPGSSARGRWSCFDLTYEDFFTSFCSIFT